MADIIVGRLIIFAFGFVLPIVVSLFYTFLLRYKSLRKVWMTSLKHCTYQLNWICKYLSLVCFIFIYSTIINHGQSSIIWQVILLLGCTMESHLVTFVFTLHVTQPALVCDEFSNKSIIIGNKHFFQISISLDRPPTWHNRYIQTGNRFSWLLWVFLLSLEKRGPSKSFQYSRTRLNGKKT